MRIMRTNGADTYKYTYHGSQLTHMDYNGTKLHFYYDASGSPLSVIYNNNTYYYVLNLQGDVVGILNSSGAQVVAYTYDAWGRPLSTTGSLASTLGQINPLRYRGYVYDQESGLYYLQSRYYNPTWGRFLNADSLVSTGQGVLGNNMFAYCNNNPVINQDSSGYAVETVFDLISLGASIVDVAVNPTDPWAWLGLIGDIADVAIPCVGGLGEAVKALKAIGAIDETVDAIKITQNTLQTISTVANTLSVGENSVYLSYQSGTADILEYVGITNDFGRRQSQWSAVRQITHYIDGVDRNTARYVEQTIISLFGKGGNTLANIRNSIGINGKLIDGYIDFFKRLF